jgi:hypothetical protein
VSHPTDYKVSEKYELQLAANAASLRKRLNDDLKLEFDPLRAIELFKKRDVTGKGLLRVTEFDAPRGCPPARVKYKPLRLFVDRDVLEAARIGFPGERFKIAHEVAHIIEHEDAAKAFSEAEARRITAFPKEQRAEWQADTFADHLLVPRKFLFAFRFDVGAIARACNVERSVVHRQIDSLKLERKYVCQACPECSNFTLARVGTVLKCETCQTVTERS